MKIPCVFLVAKIVLPLFSDCVTPSQIMADAELDLLCAIDGGIRVYETVMLSPDKLNKYGQINFYRPTLGESALGSEYTYKRDFRYYRKGDPAVQGIHVIGMKRHNIQVTRKTDMKLLGEVVMYYRVGSDFPDHWYYSSY